LALWSSGLEFDLQEVNLREKPPELWRFNPRGTVPVLVWMDEGEQRVIAQSFEIMLCALSAKDPMSWLPQNAFAWQQMMEAKYRNDEDFKSHLDRYKYPNRFPEAEAFIARDQAALLLERHENVLSEQAFLSGSHFGLMDACVAPFVRQFAKTNLDWFNSQKWPKLIHWLHAFEQSEAFTSVMTKVNSHPRLQENSSL
jgi:glutathione S-transferase